MSDKRQLLIEALRETLDACLNDAMVPYSAIPDKLVGMVLHQGWKPEEEPFVEQWRKIPGYDYWEMSNGFMVRHAMSKVGIETWTSQGKPIQITIHDNQGRDATVFLEDLAEHTWPKDPPTPVELIEEEWRNIDCIIGLASFEINQVGIIRHKKTGKIREPEYDIDLNRTGVKLIFNGTEIFIDGPILADDMWGRNK